MSNIEYPAYLTFLPCLGRCFDKGIIDALLLLIMIMIATLTLFVVRTTIKIRKQYDDGSVNMECRPLAFACKNTIKRVITRIIRWTSRPKYCGYIITLQILTVICSDSHICFCAAPFYQRKYDRSREWYPSNVNQPSLVQSFSPGSHRT